jgi:serine protease Do
VTLSSQKAQKTAMADESQSAAPALLGVQLAPAKQVSGAGDQGVVIVNVDPNGAAASKGLSDGDVILEVSGKSVSQPAEVKAEISAAEEGGKKAVLMRVKTADGARFVAFAIPKA